MSNIANIPGIVEFRLSDHSRHHVVVLGVAFIDRTEVTIHKKVLEVGLNVSRKDVKGVAQAQNTYTQYQPVVKRHDFR